MRTSLMMAFSRSLTVTPGDGAAPQTPQIREVRQHVAPPDQALLGGKRHMARIEERLPRAFEGVFGGGIRGNHGENHEKSMFRRGFSCRNWSFRASHFDFERDSLGLQRRTSL